VDVADNGVTGCGRSRSTAHDVIILGRYLPAWTGLSYQVCKRLREDGLWTPILQAHLNGEVPRHGRRLDSEPTRPIVKPVLVPILLVPTSVHCPAGDGTPPGDGSPPPPALDPAGPAVTREVPRSSCTERLRSC